MSWLTDRDVAVADSLWRYRYLTSGQLARLHFPCCGADTVRQRLVKLTRHGLVDRWRPPPPEGGGSLEFFYRLGAAGRAALLAAGAEPGRRNTRWPELEHLMSVGRANELALSVWEALGRDGWRWLGPDEAAAGSAGAALVPDAALERAGGGAILLEADEGRDGWWRERKLARYDRFLADGWQCSRYGEAERPPLALFVARDRDHLGRLLRTADFTLTARAGGELVWPARAQTVFALQDDLAAGRLVALRLPAGPPAQAGGRRATGGVPVRLGPPAAGEPQLFELLGPRWTWPRPQELEAAA